MTSTAKENDMESFKPVACASHNFIAEENESFELSDAQKRELDRRMEWVRNNPGQGRTWDEIKAEFMKTH